MLSRVLLPTPDETGYVSQHRSNLLTLTMASRQNINRDPLFFPSVFEELARDNNFLRPEKTISCTPSFASPAGTVKNLVKNLGRVRIDAELVHILSTVPKKKVHSRGHKSLMLM